MEEENHTVLSQFLLLGLSEEPELQPILFGLFLSMYLVTVLGNLLILLVVSSDSHLHTPMYFFLFSLSFVDICFTSTTIPKMLVNLYSQNKDISYSECLSQLLKAAGSDALANNIFTYVATALLCVFPMTGILFSYAQIVSSLTRMSIIDRKNKAFSTCGSHLSVISLYYGTSLLEYLSFTLTHSSQGITVASVMYTVITPMLNPFIYSLRNMDVMGHLGRLFSRAASSH
ncbi:Olfactory receptor 867 [Sciurus carolinensis]|uniref:Olfactory receptor 867 n=1 Tax=Sciurus carolinensis TaxID=30640 RepID=A0AA41N0N4_SCICA|nr:Olfactory receptor 867 [Sciurus carolinensis]